MLQALAAAADPFYLLGVRRYEVISVSRRKVLVAQATPAGGVRDGDTVKSVAGKLGRPDRVENGDDGETVWIWELGNTRGYSADYSVLIRDESVVASWFGSHPLTGRCSDPPA
jgi:hypothetical protein